METASNVDEWLDNYRKLLQHVIPVSLMQLYNTTNDAGCLNPDPDLGDLTVTIALVEVATGGETLSDKCEVWSEVSHPDYVLP